MPKSSHILCLCPKSSQRPRYVKFDAHQHSTRRTELKQKAGLLLHQICLVLKTQSAVFGFPLADISHFAANSQAEWTHPDQEIWICADVSLYSDRHYPGFEIHDRTSGDIIATDKDHLSGLVGWYGSQHDNNANQKGWTDSAVSSPEPWSEPIRCRVC